MTLSNGKRPGPYQILAPLGAGGMGEVYRARDTRLERTVAIKILPQHLASDPVRKQRLEREAKIISSLWMAYASDQTGAFEVYVRGFPSGGGQWQVSTKGGTGPSWRRDGKELFYYAPDGKLMAAEVKTGLSGGRKGPSFEPGVAHELFEFRSGADIPSAPYTVTADGQRFLLNTLVDESGGAPLTVVVNWQAELKR